MWRTDWLQSFLSLSLLHIITSSHYFSSTCHSQAVGKHLAGLNPAPSLSKTVPHPPIM
jgi:hypothetical protein